MKYSPLFERPQVLAHRMHVLGYPENTVLSLKKVVELGADWIEFDVKQLKDGALVSLHDTNVDRTTDGSGDITQMTLPEVRKLNAGKGFHFGFVPIPTCEEIISVISDCKKKGQLLKAEMHIHNLWEPQPLIDLLKKYDVLDRCYFNLNAIVYAEHIREEMDEHESLISLNIQGDDPQLKDICNRLDIAYLCVTPKNLISEFVKKVHSFRREKIVFLHSYPVQTEDGWQRVIDAGVDVIQTDYPAGLFEYLEEIGYKK